MQHSGSTSTGTTAVATPKCCERGLVYPDGGRRCGKHASADDHRLLDELDEWGEARGIPPCRYDPDERLNWPYGANIDAGVRIDMLSWAERHDLRYELRSHRCLDWLLAGRCLASRVCPTYGRQGMGAWWDHVTCWSNAKRRVLVSQPYHLDDATRAGLEAWGAEAEIRVEFADGGWYGYRAKWVALWAALDVETIAA